MIDFRKSVTSILIIYHVKSTTEHQPGMKAAPLVRAYARALVRFIIEEN